MQRGRRIAQLIEAFDSQPTMEQLDTSEWYIVNMDKVDEDLKLLYYPSSIDSQTYNFLNESTNISHSFCLQVFYGFCTIFLRAFATKTTINGILERGRMMVFSKEQIGNFLKLDSSWDATKKSVIDLGAGDGYVTQNFRPYFGHIYATEASSVMRYRLSQKGFKVLDKDTWSQSGPFDLISALNLLDRFFDPAKLLNDIHEVAHRDKALVVMAVVLPISQYVEFHPAGSRQTKADTSIMVTGRTYEEQFNTLVKNVLRPFGFELVRWSKVPYLCEGDANRPFYKLDDVLMLLRPVQKPETYGTAAYTNHVVHEL